MVKINVFGVGGLAVAMATMALPTIAGPNSLLIPFGNNGIDEGNWRPNRVFPEMNGQGVNVSLRTFKGSRKNHIRFVARVCNPTGTNWRGQTGFYFDSSTPPFNSYQLAGGACLEFETEYPKKSGMVFVAVEKTG